MTLLLLMILLISLTPPLGHYITAVFQGKISFLEKVENYAISHPRRVPPRNSVRSRNARIANVADNRSRWIRSNRSEGRPAIAVSGLLTGR